MTILRCAAVSFILLACVGNPLAAQESEQGLAALRAKQTLTEEDRAAIRKWIDQQVANIVSNDPVFAQEALANLREKSDATASFQEACAAGCVAAIGSAYRAAPVIPAARLITVLGVLKDIRSLDVLLESLQDKRTAVRAAAAIGLRDLRPKLAADAEAYSRALQALGDAGKKEPSRETLQLIYRALAYADVQPAPDLKASAATVLHLLEARLRQYAGQSLSAEGAEAVGLKVASALRPALDEAQRRRYAQAVGQMLHFAVRRYAGGEDPLGRAQDKTSGADAIALRNSTELLIKDAEKQLTKMLSLDKPPQVTDSMQRADRTAMINEMNNWVAILKEKLDLDLPSLSPASSPRGEQSSP